MKKFSLLLVLLVFSMTIIMAQTIAEYTFSTTADGTLQDMTGSSTFTNLTPGTYYDDTASAVTNIGFTFGFGLGAYTQFSVNSNGQMQLGPTAISGGSASPAANIARLAPLSGDNAIRATGKAHYLVTGTAPNRILVVEWLDLRVNFSSSTETGTYCRMQAWLYETSNNIKFVYGTMWNMSTSAQSRGVYVSTSNVAGSVGNVTDITGSPTWVNNGTGVINTIFPASSDMANLNSSADGSRRVFHINYADPSALPSPAVLLSPANGSYAMLTEALSWTSGGGYVTSYDVYLGTNPNPPFVANQTATTYAPALAGGSTYFWKIVAKNANGDATASAIRSFTTPGVNQLAESFESTSFPPAGWANPGSWYRGTTYYKHGTAGAYKSGSTSSTYVLSTPRVTITPTSTLNFWAAGSSTTTSILQVVYSADRVTWTQIGSNITPTSTYTMVNYNIDLSSLAGNNYFLGFQNGSGAGTNYIDLVIGPDITPEVPGPVTLSTPADLAVNVVEYPTFTWTAPTTGGVPTGYAVYCSTSNPPNYTTDLIGSTTGALTFTATTALAYNTTYYWTVKAYNAAGDATMPTLRSFTTRANPLITSFPWEENFGTTGATFPPLNWTQLTGLYGQALTSGGSWAQDDFGNLVTDPLNYSARLNIWSTSTKYWMVTPPIAIPANHELKFDLAYTTYSGTTTPAAGAQADDKFIVLISDNPNMTGATVLREWNNTGSPYVYDTISNTGETHILSLNAFTGTKYLAFYGESTVSGGDNNVYVDNVIVRETPAAPIFVVNPTSWDFGQQSVNGTVTKQFIIGNNGGGVINLSSVEVTGTYFTLANPPADMSLSAGENTTFTVQYAPTAIGTHAGNVAITDGRMVTNVALSGSAELQVAMTNGSTTLAIGDVLNFYDSGAAAGTYQASEDYTYTFYPPAGYRVTASFTSFVTESGYDFLRVYDGSNATATQLGSYTGTVDPFTITAAGAMTFVFTSDTSLQYAGWVAQVSLLALPTGMPDAVTLNAPADGATDLSIGGFNLSWTPAVTGGTPTTFGVYLSQDPEDMYNGSYFETTDTSLNPATYTNGPSDPIIFNYLDRWYWTVEAINNDGSAVVEPPFSFQIEDAPQIITTFPWTENFDAALTAPADWTVSDVDGGGTNWVGSTAYAHSTPNAFVHNFSTAVDEPGQNGWLITPAIQVPAGNYYLSWWNYNVYPTWMVYNGVKVNTTDNPSAAGWTELWSQETAASAWSNAVVNISAYAGQTVYFAFNYQGYDGDNWYIDDVSVYELTVDTFGPSINHVPVLNTPREDLPNYVVADIADDPTWNNPIGGANLYYSTDGETTWSAPVAMTLDAAPTYFAQIPAMPLGTTVSYYIQAWDSLNNLTTSDTFSYSVADPTWIWYDTGVGSYTWFGAGQAFSPVVLFDNPFYGSGNAVQINAVDGMAYDVNASTSVAATLHVYSWDGIGGIADFVDASGPIAVVLDHTTYETFDLSTYNIQIDTPYFVVSYDLPTGAAFLYDGTYNYGTSFANIGGTLYSLSNPGAWSIGANVQTGMNLALPTPDATIAYVGGAPTISWAAVAGANNYKVYGAADPYAADPWALVGATTALSYTYSGTEGMKFFKVVADSAAPTRTGLVLNKKNIPSLQVNAQAVRTPKVLETKKRNR